MGPQEPSPGVPPSSQPQTAAPVYEPGGESTAQPAAEASAAAPDAAREGRGNMLPRRGRRRFGLERILVRLIATFGIIAIGVALGAILAASKVQGWIIGLVVAGVSVILAGLLWSSRQL
jgi:hypothetical protein